MPKLVAQYDQSVRSNEAMNLIEKESPSYWPVRSLRWMSIAITMFLLVPQLSLSHHSFAAEFVADKTASLSGTVSQVWFKNPHVRYLLVIENEDGDEETWDARGSPVVWLARKGWGKDTIKVGDEVTIYGYLGRDDMKMLSIMTITLADGTVLVDKVPE